MMKKVEKKMEEDIQELIDNRLAEELAADFIEKLLAKVARTMAAGGRTKNQDKEEKKISKDEDKKLEEQQEILGTAKNYQDNGYDYKQFIVELIEMKKDEVMQQALDRGIKLDHLTQYSDSESFMDLDIENLIQRMINLGLVSQESGYEDIKQIKHPDGI